MTALRLAIPFAFGLAAAAAAHSSKETVVPAEGAVLDAAPAAIRMVFDTKMRITQVSLTGADGTAYALSDAPMMRPVTDFSAKPEALPPGAYTVEWRGLAADGHPMEGGWSFAVE